MLSEGAPKKRIIKTLSMRHAFAGLWLSDATLTLNLDSTTDNALQIAKNYGNQWTVQW